jgi:hypothetical protein
VTELKPAASIAVKATDAAAEAAPRAADTWHASAQHGAPAEAAPRAADTWHASAQHGAPAEAAPRAADTWHGPSSVHPTPSSEVISANQRQSRALIAPPPSEVERRAQYGAHAPHATSVMPSTAPNTTPNLAPNTAPSAAPDSALRTRKCVAHQLHAPASPVSSISPISPTAAAAAAAAAKATVAAKAAKAAKAAVDAGAKQLHLSLSLSAQGRVSRCTMQGQGT